MISSQDTNKRLNIVLSNGLCVLSAKLRKGSSLATLFISDFSDNTRVMFDLEHKRLLTNRDNIDLKQSDIDNLMLAIAEKKGWMKLLLP